MMVKVLSEMTIDRYLCLECRHRGPALKKETRQHHGGGDWEEIYEPFCADCGSPHVVEIDEE